MTDDRQEQDARLAEIRQQHARGGGALWHGECGWCLRGLVCDTAFLLNRLDALAAERDELKRMEDIVLEAAHGDIQDAQAQRDAALNERDDALAARLAAAEAAIREALYDYDHGDEIGAVAGLRAALAARGGES